MAKPNWWPQNPYPKSIFPMPREKYIKIVPDPKTRTALSGMLGREFWNIASESIWNAIKEDYEQLQADNKGLAKAVKEWRLKADTELDMNAALHTELAHVQAELAELKRMLSNCHCTNSVDNERMLLFEKIKQLQAENKQMKNFIEETDNSEAYTDYCNCNKKEGE